MTFLPNHLAPEQFPFTVEELKAYDCVILSDIGANTLLLPVPTFTKSVKMPNRAKVIRDYVLDGGALIMVGRSPVWTQRGNGMTQQCRKCCR